VLYLRLQWHYYNTSVTRNIIQSIVRGYNVVTFFYLFFFLIISTVVGRIVDFIVLRISQLKYLVVTIYKNIKWLNPILWLRRYYYRDNNTFMFFFFFYSDNVQTTKVSGGAEKRQRSRGFECDVGLRNRRHHWWCPVD